MVTNNERREVARRLHESRDTSVGMEHIWDVLDEILGTDEGSSYETPWDKTFDRLADLIDPNLLVSGEATGEGTSTSHLRGVAEMVDREALLELADDLERMQDGSIYDPYISDYYGVARRIREALGVDE